MNTNNNWAKLARSLLEINKEFGQLWFPFVKALIRHLKYISKLKAWEFDWVQIAQEGNQFVTSQIYLWLKANFPTSLQTLWNMYLCSYVCNSLKRNPYIYNSSLIPTNHFSICFAVLVTCLFASISIVNRSPPPQTTYLNTHPHT